MGPSGSEVISCQDARCRLFPDVDWERYKCSQLARLNVLVYEMRTERGNDDNATHLGSSKLWGGSDTNAVSLLD